MMDFGGGPPRGYRLGVIAPRLEARATIARRSVFILLHRHHRRFTHRWRQFPLHEALVGTGGDYGNRALASAAPQCGEKMNLGDTVNGNLIDDGAQKSIARVGTRPGAHRAPTAATGGA
jgi:hypothetical protein